MLIGFKSRFIEPIQIGTKVFTLRKKRKQAGKVGEQLYMYSGLRTKHCYKISDKERLISTQQVQLFLAKEKGGEIELKVVVDGKELKGKGLQKFINFDGFTDADDLIGHFLGGKKSGKVEGEYTLYHWTDLRF